MGLWSGSPPTIPPRAPSAGDVFSRCSTRSRSGRSWTGRTTGRAPRTWPSTATGTTCTSSPRPGTGEPGVEDVLGASLEDAAALRLVFPDILGDLRALAEANAAGDGEEVYRKLGRLDSRAERDGAACRPFLPHAGRPARPTTPGPRCSSPTRTRSSRTCGSSPPNSGATPAACRSSARRRRPPVWTA